MTTIGVGDVVTWRDGKTKLAILGKRSMPLGIAGCQVVDIGKTATGEPAALLRLPEMFHDAIRDQGLNPEWGVAALVSDLEKN